MRIRRFCINAVIVLVSIFVALAACEMLLVAIQWSPQKTTSDYLQFGYSTGVPVWDEDGILEEAQPVRVKLFQSDDELFWKTIPHTEFTNAQGFRGTQDVSVENRNESIRILVLGDSCSFLGRKLYTEYLQEKLTDNFPGESFEIINASVPGYTSFQGKKILQELLQYKPHYAFVYFGWNDHWILPSGYSDQFHYELIQSFKVVQLARILMARVLDLRDYRVPLDEYRKNLREIVTRLKDHNIIPVLIAAPAGYSEKGMPRWAFQFYKDYYRMTDEEISSIPETHAAYAAAVAEVAKQHDAILVDVQAQTNRWPLSRKDFFRNDLIHLKDQGHETIANEIYRQILDHQASEKTTWESLLRQ